jgi:hypothetical protein
MIVLAVGEPYDLYEQKELATSHSEAWKFYIISAGPPVYLVV